MPQAPTWARSASCCSGATPAGSGRAQPLLLEARSADAEEQLAAGPVEDDRAELPERVGAEDAALTRRAAVEGGDRLGLQLPRGDGQVRRLVFGHADDRAVGLGLL